MHHAASIFLTLLVFLAPFFPDAAAAEPRVTSPTATFGDGTVLTRTSNFQLADHAEGDAETWLDAGYVGPACEAVLAGKGILAKICEKGARNRPLTAKQKRSNRAKSRKRCRVEHVFGYMTMNMKAMVKRHIGLKRNRASIIFCNLVYNIARTEQIIRLKLLGRRTPSFC